MFALIDSTALVLADWDGPGWWIGFAPIVSLLVLVAFAFLLRVLIFRGGRGPGAWGWGAGRHAGPPSADEVLRRRFAEGELSADEYRERRAVLDERPASGRTAPEGPDASV
jgi:putative membrane protein